MSSRTRRGVLRLEEPAPKSLVPRPNLVGYSWPDHEVFGGVAAGHLSKALSNSESRGR